LSVCTVVVDKPQILSIHSFIFSLLSTIYRTYNTKHITTVFIFSAPSREQSVVMSVSVCFVCASAYMSVCPRAYLRNSTSDLHQIFGASYRRLTHSGRGYMTLVWRRCGYTLCTSGFMDDVIFAQLRPVGLPYLGGLAAEWLACWTQAQNGPGSNRSRDAVE